MFKMFMRKKCFYFLILFVLVGSDSVFDTALDSKIYRFKRQARPPCSKTQFQCNNGQCISQNAICNGIKNCIDGSDEKWEACEKKYPSSCLLPIQNADKSFILNCDSSTAIRIFQSSRGDFVEELTLLSFGCNSENKSEPYFQSVCLRGKWTPSYSECLKTCPSITYSPNVKIKCSLNNEDIDCKVNHYPGTSIRPICDSNFFPNVEESVCQKSGQWSSDKIECIGCGILQNNVPPFQYPWTVAVFAKEPFTLVCAGTIVSPNVILTAASCFTGYQGSNPDNFILVVGKSRRIPEEHAPYQRSYSIKKILLHESFQENDFSNDIAIIQPNNITFNAGVYSVCTEWDQFKYTTLKDDSLGEVANYIVNEATAAFNSTKYIDAELEVLIKSNLELQYMSNSKCQLNTPQSQRRFLTQEKFCARLKTNQPLILIDKGTGFFVKNSQKKYVLRGIASGMYSAANNYRIFTDISKYLKWISSNILHNYSTESMNRILLENRNWETSTNSHHLFVYDSLRINCTPGEIHTEFVDGCTLPNKNIFHIDFEVTCTESIFQGYCNRSIENAPVPQYTSLRYKCQRDYASYSHETFENSICFKRNWIPPIQQCKKICEKLEPDNVQLKCTYEGRNVNCEDNLIVNTEISVRCLPEYKPNVTTWTNSIFCREDRKWSAPLLRCVPICGRPSTTKITPTIHYGENVSLGEFPWHAAVYDRVQNDRLICGATIISPYTFISAAHCFYNRSKDRQRNAEEFQIAVGKVTRDYKTRDSETTHFYDVDRLIFNNFRGLNLRYQRDIIIIVSKTKILFNSQVSPICLFEDSNIRISSGALLNIPGWGLDETLNPNGSPTLKVANLPFISFDECSKIAPSAILDFLATEKFCAGFVNDTALDQGDSGGGLVHQNSLNNFYYLVGIVSIRAINQASLALSTYVPEYLPWIHSNLDEIDKRN